jgi:hypothetical protein
MTDSKTPDWAKEEARDVESWWSNGGKSISTRDLLQQRISQALLSAYERGRKEGIEDAAKVSEDTSLTRYTHWGTRLGVLSEIATAIRQLLEVKG